VVTQASVFKTPELWVLGDDGSRQRNLTEHGAIETNVRGCAGTDYVLFLSNRTGDWKIWRTGRDGSNPVQITSGPGVDGSPSCSPDGKWVIFSSNRAGPRTLWKTSIDGGEAVQFLTEVSYHPEVSPDGRLLVCAYYDAQAQRDGPVAVLDMTSHRPVARFRTISDQVAIRWTGDSRSLTYVRTAGGVSNIYIQPVSGGPERPLTHFKSERLFAFDWSPDGAKIAYIRGMEAHDAVRITFR
jgi:Tol biopolymer transport system component